MFVYIIETLLEHFCIPVLCASGQHYTRYKKRKRKKKYHIFGQYLDTQNDQEFTNIETFSDLRP